MHTDDLRHLIVRLADEPDSGIRARGYREAASGSLLRIAPGRHVAVDEWDALGVNEQHQLRVLAASERLSAHDTVSHWSAAALWSLPLIGRWPDRVHVTSPPTSHRKSTRTLVRHRRALATPVIHRDGVALTSLAETVIDVARVGSFAQAVAVGDAALWRAQHPRDSGGMPGLTLAQLDHVWRMSVEHRGLARARRVLQFIDGRANRPGESLVRVTLAALGAPAPVLQHPIVMPDGTRYDLDFYFPESDVGLEFDGRAKYLDPAFRDGRSAEQVVYDEKIREDQVRSQLRGFGRCDWTVAGSAPLLAALLRRIGVRW